MKAHVHRISGIGQNYVVGDTVCGGVVHLDGKSWLWPVHLNEGLTQGGHHLGGDEEGSEFRLCSGGHKKLMICARMRTGLLMAGTGISLEIIICAPARIQELRLLMYEASAWAVRTISLEQ